MLNAVKKQGQLGDWFLSDCHLKGDLMGLDLLLAEIAAISQKGGMRVRVCWGVWESGADQSDFASVLF